MGSEGHNILAAFMYRLCDLKIKSKKQILKLSIK